MVASAKQCMFEQGGVDRSDHLLGFSGGVCGVRRPERLCRV